jgi:hypothetical protein
MEVQILRHQCRAVYFEKKTIKPILHFMKAWENCFVLLWSMHDWLSHNSKNMDKNYLCTKIWFPIVATGDVT